MSYYITTEATCDLPQEYYEEDFAVIPMDFSVNGEDYNTATRPLDPHEFYELEKKGALPTTSLVNTFTAVEFLTPILEKGYDVYHVAFSSALSGTYNSMLQAKKELEEKFPNRKIYVIDSRQASGGEGLMAYHALQKRKAGATIEELAEYMDAMRDRLLAYFTVDDLKHLVRTGRISKIAGNLGTALKLKPVLYVNYYGELVNIEKAHGRKKALDGLVDKMKEKFVECPENETIAITNGDAPDIEDFYDKIRAAFPNIKTIIKGSIGPVIGSHSGPATIALFFIGKDKLEKKDPHVRDMIKE